jgi:formate dehydrogenase subunit gamma
LTTDEQAQLEAILEPLKAVEGGLLPILHAVQDHFGYVPEHAIPTIAAALNLSRAEVHGVVSFYHDFRASPGGRHTVQVCAAEACQAVGSRQLEQAATRLLGVDFGETTTDGAMTLQRVYCLGNCACGPSLRIDDEIHAMVDERRLAQLLAELATHGAAP